MTDTDSVSGRSRPRVLLLGAGQLGAELAVALQRLGAQVIVAEPAAGPGVDEVVALSDTDALSAAISGLRPDVVVAGSDAVAVEALRLAGQSGAVQVVPSARSVRLAADREELRHLVTEDIGVPTVPFWFAGSPQELAEVTEEAGYPLVVSPLAADKPGDGQSVLVRPDDIEPAWRRAIAADGHSGRVLAESVIQTDFEITQLVVVTDEDDVQFCAPIGHRRTADGRGLECWQPQPMSTIALDSARSVAGRVVRALGGRGLFAVDLAIRDDEVFFRDAGVFPADTGLVTLRTQRLSQFELAARAVLGLPADTVLISPGAARLLYTEFGAVPAAALSEPETDVRVFGPGCRSAVALATAGDVDAALARAVHAADALPGVAQL
ncbi:formate-dependent phosphoribosylglycinamide formyltransferase [Mycobacterium sp. 1274756.6]|uniref:formate-dependent phosphoribosylglycinamide formyltransferase n=1 Tax=Mycobacterium sp. 1274756.6 TaxID=1834076 RepID=UPI0009ED8581|nr:formate-dependent phosphoribosylglycinamide formyltransferase [Mycobacterium sp. 1274756.6]